MRWTAPLLLLAACGGSPTSFETSARDTRLVDLDLVATCPAASVGEATFGSLTLANRSNRMVHVDRVRTRASSPVSVSFIDGFELDRRSERTLQLRCIPFADGSNVQPIFVETNVGTITVEVEVVGRAAVAIVSAPRAVDLPFVPGEDHASVISVRMTNGGSDPLRFIAQPDVEAPFAVSAMFDWRDVVVASARTRELRFLVRPNAIGRFEGQLTLATNDPRRPRIEIPLVLTATERGECSLTFDRAAVNPVGLRLVNSGASVCDLTGFAIDGVFGAERARILPGRAFDLSVDPAAVSATSVLTFFGNGGALQPAAVPLFESDAVECLQPSVLEVDFGSVSVSCAEPTRWVSVRNTCSMSVVASASVSSGSAFTPAAVAPVLLEPGASFSARVRFSPAAVGVHQSELRWTALVQGRASSAVVTLLGRADAALPEQVEVFVDARVSVDFAVVVAAPDMFAGDGGYARKQLEYMTYSMPYCGDWRIAVIRAGDGGTLIHGADGGAPLVTGSTAEVIPELLSRIERAAKGSTHESLEGLAAVPASFPPKDVSHRGALLLSTGADSSRLPVWNYAREYLAAWPRAHTMLIGPFDLRPKAGCPSGGHNERLSGFSSMVNGWTWDYCWGNWFPSTLPPGRCSSLHELRLLAVPRTVPKVLINGRDLPHVDARGAVAWTYDSVLNAIRFEWTFVPEPGDVVTVRYLPACTAQ